MYNVRSTNLPLNNVHGNKAKYVHKIGCVKVRKAVYIQSVKVQDLYSGLRVASESSMTPVGTAWMCGGNCQYNLTGGQGGTFR